jgi:predicted nucleic acid-binding protein
MIAFVDTSALYALLDRDDGNHQSARKTWTGLLDSRALLVTGNYALVIFPLLATEWVTRSQHDSALASLLAAGRKKLSLVDCASFAVMRQAGIRKAFAFDRHFTEQGFEIRF